jgi:hypothetical protein
MIEITTRAHSHAHVRHQNDVHLIVLVRIGIISLVIDHLGFAAIAAV